MLRLTLFIIGTLVVGSTSRAQEPYQLNAKELALDCAKLTGHMKLRIMQLRDADPRSGPNQVGRAMQSVAAEFNGAPRRGMDPRADTARDHALVEAYNRRLVEKKCKPVDIEAELNGQPTATPPAAAKK